jgi:2-oxoglutarate ferredoxin oxidoreductase subunit alpha
MSREVLDGSAAIASAAIRSGCRFFAGYPMSPFIELLESFSRLLPEHGGVCMNAESEIEAVNMALGASSTGARAATGSCGQGLALMQEAIAELALNELPMVVFNMARSQQDYFQATRGGGWGDYRTLTLAPKDVPEAVAHTHLLFDLADRYRTPVILYGDDPIAHTTVAVDVEPPAFDPLPAKTWALDGSLGGTGRSRAIWAWRHGKPNNPGPGPEQHWRDVAAKYEMIAEREQRWEVGLADDADTLVVAFGTVAKFVESAVRDLRADGHRVGWFRPISLWPFPTAALEDAARGVSKVLVMEINAGQMVDDVHLAVQDRRKVTSIGDISTHEHGLRYGSLLDPNAIRHRIERQLDPTATGATT